MEKTFTESSGKEPLIVLEFNQPETDGASYFTTNPSFNVLLDQFLFSNSHQPLKELTDKSWNMLELISCNEVSAWE